MSAPRFPLFVDLDGKRAVIFGGGTVAARRAAALLPFGADVTVISPACCADMERLGLRVERRGYRPGDCAGFDLALAATNDRAVNRAVHLEARAAGVPVNVCDAPGECDFFFPAVARRGHLVVGVTASGLDHGLARRTAQNIRERLDELAPPKGEDRDA